jgi:AcrR family transcriptional regulator
VEAAGAHPGLPLLTAYAGGIATPAEDTPAPRRGRPPSLSEGQIAEAAIELSNRVGLERLTMRGLAADLDVPVMTLYNYVANKQALFDLISDHLLRPVVIPDASTGTWDQRMRVLQRSTRAAVRRHIGLRSGTGVGQSTEAARLADGAMSILADAGFEPDQAELAFATLFTFMLGQIELDALMNAAEDTDGSVTPSVERDRIFEFSFDVMLDGLERRFRRR